MNYASVLALVSGFILILLAMLVGGSPTSFLDLPSFLIVVDADTLPKIYNSFW